MLKYLNPTYYCSNFCTSLIASGSLTASPQTILCELHQMFLFSTDVSQPVKIGGIEKTKIDSKYAFK